jgi:hypothetical protein
MKAIAKLYFNKAKSPKEKVKIDGAKNVAGALGALGALGELIGPTAATRVDIRITVPRRRSS